MYNLAVAQKKKRGEPVPKDWEENKGAFLSHLQTPLMQKGMKSKKEQSKQEGWFKHWWSAAENRAEVKMTAGDHIDWTPEEATEECKAGGAHFWTEFDCSKGEALADMLNQVAKETKREKLQKQTGHERRLAEQKNDELVEEVMNYLLHKNGAK